MKFNTTTLEKKKPRFSFQIETQWIVFTGAACAGKTSTLEKISSLGFQIKKEIARSYFEKNPRTNEASCQRDITAEKLALEDSLNPADRIFLDRGMPDSITYYRMCGLDPKEAIPFSIKYKYKKVFIFESLPMKEDGIRIENDDTSTFIREWLEKDYMFLGYDVIKVPADTLDNRVDLILSQIGS